MCFQVENLSKRYKVRMLDDSDVAAVYALCKENPLYYQYCPPFVTEDSIRADMAALPPRKTPEDKFYLGFYEDEKLIAVMDLILAFPNDETAFIGLFMVHGAQQGKGIGSRIVSQALDYLHELGFQACRLGYVKTNQQSRAFWEKNGFLPTGVQSKQEKYTIVIMERKIS